MDEMIIKKACRGDKESFAEALMEVKDTAYRIAYCYLHNEHDSMDAVCDAAEKALRNIRKLKDPKYFKTWVIRIVINECKMQLRRRGRAIQMADSFYEGLRSVETDSEGKTDLGRILGRLEPTDRVMIYLKYYNGYTLDEIADLMKIPGGTVRTRIYTNLKAMKQALAVKEV